MNGLLPFETALPIPGATEIRFNGSDYSPAQDDVRLTGQILRIFELMRDGEWRTMSEIEAETGDPQASISAQLRHLRKARFGGHTVLKRSRGERVVGLYEYRLIVSEVGSYESTAWSSLDK